MVWACVFDVDLLEVHSELWISPVSLQCAGDEGRSQLVPGVVLIWNLAHLRLWILWWSWYLGRSGRGLFVHTDLVRVQSSRVIL